MAANPIPKAINDLFRLSKKCQTAASAIGPGIPLMINTASAIGSDRGGLLQLEGQYQRTLGLLPTARAEVIEARGNAADFARTSRRWLENTFGHRWNQQWRAAGFIHNSLEIPVEDDAELAALLERMQIFYGAHPTQENLDPKVNVTAERAGELAGALSGAGSSLNTTERLSAEHKKSRNTAKRGLSKRLSGLVAELGQRLADDDARWLEFGFNMPSAENVPAVPKHLVAMNVEGPGNLLVKCAPSAYATHYRFFLQTPGVDVEPVFAGTAHDPMFLFTGLIPGQSYLVLITAANAGAESRFSQPLSAVISGEQEEAA